MSTPLIVFIAIHLISLAYFVELLRRVYVRVREYDLRETGSTLPFGFLRLRHVIVFYVATYLVWVFASVFLYFTLITPSSEVGPVHLQNLNLNW